jgi:hypothetical protein
MMAGWWDVVILFVVVVTTMMMMMGLSIICVSWKKRGREGGCEGKTE